MSDIFRISSKVVVTSGFRQKKLADTKRITIEEEEEGTLFPTKTPCSSSSSSSSKRRNCIYTA